MRQITYLGSFFALSAILYFDSPSFAHTNWHNLGALSINTQAIVPENYPATSAETKSMLTKGSWKIKSIVSDKPCDTDGDGRLTTDVASEMPQCALDDDMAILANGKVVFNRFERCWPEEQAKESFTWKLSGDNKFVLSKGNYRTEMIFKSVTKDELVLVVPTEAMGVMYYFTVTYVHEVNRA